MEEEPVRILGSIFAISQIEGSRPTRGENTVRDETPKAVAAFGPAHTFKGAKLSVCRPGKAPR